MGKVIDLLRALVRPVVTLAMAGALIYGFFLDKIDAFQFLALASGCVLWWYSSRKTPPAKPSIP